MLRTVASRGRLAQLRNVEALGFVHATNKLATNLERL